MFDDIFRRKMLIFISFDPYGRFNENLSKENGYTLMEAGIKEALDLAMSSALNFLVDSLSRVKDIKVISKKY